jgi:hypothetical protein
MPAWKVLLIAVLFFVCLGLAFASFVVPMTTAAGGNRWLWLGGLLGATVLMGTLMALFLRRSGRLMQ